ncbi:MFS transporter [Dyella sp.]|uniref:MFS transporter n=1 Tax=Dyella sp. TaxID=1869338 RepID=UPI002ECFF0AA
MNTHDLPTRSRGESVKAIVRVVSGNFLEMYDFMVYGYYASAIAHAYFPAKSQYASLLLTLLAFAAGFVMRPVGAVVLGAYIDHHGRRKGLILTLLLMAIGTLLVAAVPGYDRIGVLAPVLVLAGRLLQGFSAGVELGGVSVYLSEIARPGTRGFYCAWQSASQQVAVVFAALLGLLLQHWLTPAQVSDWGWRVPFLVGCLIVPFLFLIRRSLEETESFLARRRPGIDEIFRSMLANSRIVLLGVALVMMTTVSFYLITAYTPTFGSEVLKLSQGDVFVVTLCVGVSNFVWLPLMGALSDRIGRRPLLLACTALALLTAYPTLRWLVAEPDFGRLLTVELWLSFIYASYNGAMVVSLTEIMPEAVRTTGFSLAYSLATTVGGSSLAISQWLIHVTGDRAAPGLWMSFAALCGLVATLWVFGDPRHRDLHRH